jgi:hypothetical protein
MTWALRSCALAVGAAALLSTQAVYAAPVRAAPAVDPLVSLSLLGTAQSRAAVCAAGTAATASAAAAAAAAQAPAPTNCLLPITGAPPVAEVAPPPPALVAAAPGKQIGVLPILLGALVLAGLLAAILSGGGDGDGDLGPISPA